MLIRDRLRLLFIALLSVFFGAGALALIVIHDLDNAIQEGSSGRSRLIEVGKVRDLLLEASSEIEDLQSWGNKERKVFLDRLQECRSILSRMQEENPEEDQLFQAAMKRLSRPVTDFSRAVTRALRYLDEEGAQSKNLDLPKRWLKTRLIPDITEAMQTLEQLLQGRSNELEISSQLNSSRVKLIFQTTSISLILFGFVFYVLIGRWIVNPLELLSKATREISNGRYGEIIPISSQGELGQLARDVESMSKEIATSQEKLVDKERLAAVGEMTATIAHNLRNPLGSIRALAQNKMRSDPEPDASGSLKQILQTVDRADRWLKDLLKGLKPIRLTVETVNLTDRLPQVCEAVLGYAEKRQVKVTWQLDQNLPVVQMDGRKVEQSILVLLNNAIESCDPGGAVSLSGQYDRDRIHITVVDNGHGMTQETLANLFKPYFTTKKSGLGLGLSLTQRIMASHGGQINVESEAGVGSSFALVIPINSKMFPKEE